MNPNSSTSIEEIHGADDIIQLKHLILLKDSKSTLPEGVKRVPVRMVLVSIDSQLLIDVGAKISGDVSFQMSDSSESSSEDEQLSMPGGSQSPNVSYIGTGDPMVYSAPILANEDPMCILYIGDLDQRVTEDFLRVKFEKYTDVKSVTLRRDPTTMQPIGSAFVTFFNPTDAEEMRITLSGSKILGTPMRIMKYQPNPESSNTEGNLFVKNLHWSIDNKKLYDIFAIYGTVLSCKVVFRDGKSLCYGYVQFESKDVAKKAMEELNGTVHFSKEIKVEAFQSYTTRYQVQAPNTKIYVSNYENSNWSNIVSKFEKCGKIEDIHTTNSNEFVYATINFEDIESAKTAVNEVNGLEMDGLKLYVGFVKNEEMLCLDSAQNQEAEQTETGGQNKFIQNLPPQFNNESFIPPFIPGIQYYNAIYSPSDMYYYQPVLNDMLYHQNLQNSYPHTPTGNLHFRTDVCTPTWETFK